MPAYDLEWLEEARADAGLTMVNNTGLRNGIPYLTVLPAGSLLPGGAVSVSIQFTNPNAVVITFTPETDSGAF